MRQLVGGEVSVIRECDGAYWDSHDLMTRNGMFNIAIGGRGTGKTYDFKYKRIKHYIKTSQGFRVQGRQFIYVRRYKTELEDRQTFFDDVRDNFPECDLKVEGMRMFIRRHREMRDEKDKGEKWWVLGYFIVLATALTKKSVPYPDVDWIGMDEFIIDKGNLHYLQNETKQFLDFYNTVDRFQDRVRVMLMANAVSIVNPYFIDWRISPRKGKRFTSVRGGFIQCEYIDSELYRRRVDATRFGQFIKGTSYYDYAVSNSFRDMTDKFIAKKTTEAVFRFSIRFDGRTVGIWADWGRGLYFVCGKYPKDGLCYVLTKDDMLPNLLMLEKSNAIMKGVKRAYMQGSVLFDTPRNREFFTEVLEYIGL